MDFGQLSTVRTTRTGSRTRARRLRAAGSRPRGPQIRGGGQPAASRAARRSPSTQLGVPVASLTVSKGVVSGGGKSVTYGALIGDKLLQRASWPRRASTRARRPSKPVAQYTLVGDAARPRVDIPDKVTGKYIYVHNIRVPGMLHGRVVRPRGQGAYGDGRCRRSSRSTRARSSTSRASRGRAQGRLPRRRRADGVRRDPGGRAAEGEVDADPPPIAEQRQPLEVDARPRHRRPGAGADRGQTRATSTPRFASAREGAPATLQVPLQRPRCRSARLRRSPT